MHKINYNDVLIKCCKLSVGIFWGWAMHTLEKLVLPSGVASSTQSLFEYWCSIRGREIVPNRSDIKPVAILPLLPNLMILEYRADDALVYRLAGTACAEKLGKELTGSNLFDHIAPHQRTNARFCVNMVRGHPCGLLVYEKLQSRHNTPFVAEIIYLPLRDSNGVITQLIGSVAVVKRGEKEAMTHAAQPMIAVAAQFLDIGAGMPQAMSGEVRRAV